MERRLSQQQKPAQTVRNLSVWTQKGSGNGGGGSQVREKQRGGWEVSATQRFVCEVQSCVSKKATTPYNHSHGTGTVGGFKPMNINEPHVTNFENCCLRNLWHQKLHFHRLEIIPWGSLNRDLHVKATILWMVTFAWPQNRLKVPQSLPNQLYQWRWIHAIMHATASQ